MLWYTSLAEWMLEVSSMLGILICATVFVAMLTLTVDFLKTRGHSSEKKLQDSDKP